MRLEPSPVTNERAVSGTEQGALAKAAENLFSGASMPINGAQLETTFLRNARLVPVEPKVKSAKTREIANRGVSGNSKTGKSADPTCYDLSTVELTGLFDMERRMTPLWKKGDVVTIYQLTFGGGLIVEGKATVVKPLDAMMEHYMVRFHRKDGKLEREAFERFIDREGQGGDPQTYVDTFNKRIGFQAA